jgi:hypothetical protein
MSMKTLTVLGDIWQTDQPDLLEFAAKNAVPRRGSRLLQLRLDLRSPLMWLLLTLGAAGGILGVLKDRPEIFVLPIAMLLIIGFMFLSVAKGHSRSTLMRGVVKSVEGLRDHPMLLGQVAKASLVSKELVTEASVSLTSDQAVDLLRQSGRLEVLVLHDPKAEYSSVIGWRSPA